MKILFLGTPDFASEHLKYLIENRFKVAVAISQPDKPKGRGKKLLPTPVKEVAMEYGIPIFQPKNINKEGIEIIGKFKPDLAVVVAYGKLLKPPFLDALPFYNVHASLLPKYRGAAPIQRALENGEKKTGITIFKIGIGMDDGPITLQKGIGIGEYETFGELYEKLLNLGKETLVEFLNKYPMKLVPQTGEPTYAPKITSEDLKIDFNYDFIKVKNKIRAYDPIPGARADFKGDIVKLFGVFFAEKSNYDSSPGKVLEITKDGAFINCKNGVIGVKYIQFPGKRKIAFLDAKNGKLVKEGDFLGKG